MAFLEKKIFGLIFLCMLYNICTTCDHRNTISTYNLSAIINNYSQIVQLIQYKN